MFLTFSFEISTLMSSAIKMISYLFTAWLRVFHTSSKNEFLVILGVFSNIKDAQLPLRNSQFDPNGFCSFGFKNSAFQIESVLQMRKLSSVFDIFIWNIFVNVLWYQNDIVFIYGLIKSFPHLSKNEFLVILGVFSNIKDAQLPLRNSQFDPNGFCSFGFKNSAFQIESVLQMRKLSSVFDIFIWNIFVNVLWYQNDIVFIYGLIKSFPHLSKNEF